MCEFCHKHGEGKKWYLQAKNYSDDLVSDLRRRRRVGQLLKQWWDDPARNMRRASRLLQTRGVIRRLLSWGATRTMKKLHFGQVVPIEDVERILDLTNSVVRMACACRYAGGMKDARYCYGVSIRPDGGVFGETVREVEPDYLTGPDTAGLEDLTKDEALERMREHEREGLCHSVWTLMTPFIVGVCNCDRADCLAMQATVTHGVKTMFRAEYVAGVDPEPCSGCRECMRVCPFGAIGFSAARRTVEIDPKKCFGCGVCRSVCPRGAITLVERREVPAAKNVW